MNETIPMLGAATEEKQSEQTVTTVPRKHKRLRSLPMRTRLALAMLLCVGLLLCRIAAPETAKTLRRWVVGDGSEQVQQAFFSMEQALEQGVGMGEAWEAFCAELTDEPA